MIIFIIFQNIYIKFRTFQNIYIPVSKQNYISIFQAGLHDSKFNDKTMRKIITTLRNHYNIPDLFELKRTETKEEQRFFKKIGISLLIAVNTCNLFVADSHISYFFHTFDFYIVLPNNWTKLDAFIKQNNTKELENLLREYSALTIIIFKFQWISNKNWKCLCYSKRRWISNWKAAWA